MTRIDRDRLAAALHNLHAKSVIRMPKHGNPEHVYNVAGKLIAEYDRLTAEWREHLGNGPALSSAATPTRNQGRKG